MVRIPLIDCTPLLVSRDSSRAVPGLHIMKDSTMVVFLTGTGQELIVSAVTMSTPYSIAMWIKPTSGEMPLFFLSNPLYSKVV